MGNGNNQNWKSWNVPPGQLKQELEDAFKGAAPGVYAALEVKVENPISEYRIITPAT